MAEACGTLAAPGGNPVAEDSPGQPLSGGRSPPQDEEEDAGAGAGAASRSVAGSGQGAATTACPGG